MQGELVPDKVKVITTVRLEEPVIGESLDPAVIWMVGFGFLAVVALMVVYLLLRRWWMNRAEARQQAHVERYQNYLAEFTATSLAELFETEGVTSNNTYRLETQDLRKRSRRQLLARQIFELHQQLSGTQATALKTLYLGLTLFEDTKRHLRSQRVDVAIQAMREVKAYGLMELLPTVEELLQSKQEALREEALLVCLELVPDNLALLERFPEVLNNWWRHRILCALQRKATVSEAHLDQLLSAETHHAPFYRELKAELFPTPVHYEVMIEQMAAL